MDYKYSLVIFSIQPTISYKWNDQLLPSLLHETRSICDSKNETYQVWNSKSESSQKEGHVAYRSCLYTEKPPSNPIFDLVFLLYLFSTDNQLIFWLTFDYFLFKFSDLQASDVNCRNEDPFSYDAEFYYSYFYFVFLLYVSNDENTHNSHFFSNIIVFFFNKK